MNHPLHKNQTMSSIQHRPKLPNNHPISSPSQLQLHNRSTLRSQILPPKKNNLSDSESSEASCIQKKYYRCGCRTHSSCGHKYQNYLAELREERLRKKQKIVEYFTKTEDRLGDLTLSEDENLLDSVPLTPPKSSQLKKIIQISESAQASLKKFELHLNVTFGGQQYEMKVGTREQAVKIISVLESLIGS